VDRVEEAEGWVGLYPMVAAGATSGGGLWKLKQIAIRLSPISREDKGRPVVRMREAERVTGIGKPRFRLDPAG
jgi:hypothetical protein